MTNTELIQKIKAEIDKLYGEYKNKFHQCGDQYHLGLIDGLDMAERVLDSIESEKPVPKHLEEAVSEQICVAADKHIRKAADTAGHPGWDWTTQDIADAFIAGAEWQKEQKPAEWSEEDERRIDAICELLENTSAIHPNYSRRKLIIWLKSLRPHWKPSEEQKPAEWSEEDERILKGIIGKIDHDQTYGVSKAEMLSFLEGLRPSWKPREEDQHQKEQVLNALRLELNKWLNHSIRGMKSGNPAYFQGKITLIHDLLGFIHDFDNPKG